MFTIDTSTEFGARITKQLADELVIWLTTVGGSGTPAPNPVWFHWNGQQVLVFSQAAKAKVHNIERNPRVALHFNATFTGGDVGVLSGTAVIDGSGPTAEELAMYDAKYAEGLASLTMSAEDFHREYPVLIRITPDKLRGF
ncbi:pyridoxamine 5'-phosphate oxidase-related FMN- binding protein [Kribbella flavida DSM 17836]|uniref:Pyridoxamine 5'-phosphate oxidase-related FMN-binding protein n=1 Tax=Kribbella flavida (strain DSM 17836 / JCM 10339 / NBRC 14399) TaxID=479435 RepID=D2PLT8_KRIFD|nr:TIGR03667 family PPOX class F420-dependent oxidoreductase [Kribbella flavida]ADB32518.1 pyridoxamine 5'-phosphate oxidase-related FMN- binding protein [Kribbella flavida DSM 17836]